MQPLSAFRSTNPPRKLQESENQRLYEMEQKKLREQQSTPPSAPMRAFFKNGGSQAASLSLHGTEVTSVHTAGDVTRLRPNRANLNVADPTEKLKFALNKVAKQKEIYLEQKWFSWLETQELNPDKPRNQEAPAPPEEKKLNIKSLKPLRKQSEIEPAPVYEVKVALSRTTKILGFSKRTGIATGAIIECLEKNNMGSGLTSNSVIDMAAQELVCIEFGKTPVIPEILDVEAVSTSVAEPRSAVVCVMGHVDHGKTSLLDRLRQSNVQASEAGGITQSIGAFKVSSGAVFLDTPGHAAFSSMRARGADKDVTDVVVLVVAIDSGVQPQTVEAIELAQAGGVPIIVAITKCDLGDDDSAVKRALLSHGLQGEDQGGDTIFVHVSAKTGQGMDELLRAIETTTEMLDLKAPVDSPARAYVIESTQRLGLGCVANVVVRSGTIHVGDIVICGTECVKVRALFDEHGEKLKSCGPSTPVSVVGFKDINKMSSILRAVESEAKGELIVQERIRKQREAHLQQPEEEREGGRVLRTIIKATTKGSLEAFQKYVDALPQDEIQIMVLKSGVGPLLEGDVQQAQQFGAELFSFGPPVAENVIEAGRIRGVPIYHHDIIYSLMDSFRDAVSKQLPPTTRMDVLGNATILQVFERDGKKKATIHAAGCRVNAGKVVSRDPKGGTIRYRVLREGNELTVSGIDKLFHFKDEVQAVEKGQECCIVLDGWTDFVQGDLLECVSTTNVQPVFDDSAGRAS